MNFRRWGLLSFVVGSLGLAVSEKVHAEPSDDEVIKNLEDSLDKGVAPPASVAPPATTPSAPAASTTTADKPVDAASATPSATSPTDTKAADADASPAAPPVDATAAAEVAPESFKEGEAPKVEAPVAEAPKEAAEEAPPAEVKALEKALKAGNDPDLPPALYEPQEPGGTLKPSDRFSRIPLHPRMSDSNWRRWAGPLLEKNYRIRRNDTLWGVSEKLFGNPYLWPKVWQLNAQIPNPHVITPNLELSFTPGNPNSAPVLAFKTFPGKSSEELPLMTTGHTMSFMEFLDETLRAQILSSHPPFQYFFLDEKPQVIGLIPKPENPLRIFHDEGEGFLTKTLADGEYSIVRIRPIKNKFYSAYKVRWVGKLKVVQGRATIPKAFVEVSEGDQIVSRNFTLSPLALYEYRFGSQDRDDTEIIPVQEGYETLASENMLIGLRFAGADRGPRAGAIMTVSQGIHKVATILLVDRDRRLGTAWVVESTRELDSKRDKLD